MSVEADFASAVELAFERTPAEGALLFSPACASFDAYANFRARAEHFRERIHTVKA